MGGEGFVVCLDACQFFPAAGELFMCSSCAVFYLGIGDPWDHYLSERSVSTGLGDPSANTEQG